MNLSSEDLSEIKKYMNMNPKESRYHFVIQTSNKQTIAYPFKKMKYKANRKFNSSNNFDRLLRPYTIKHEEHILQPDFKYYCYLCNNITNEIVDRFIINKAGFILEGKNLNGINAFEDTDLEYLKHTISSIIDNEDIDIKIIDLQERYKY